MADPFDLDKEIDRRMVPALKVHPAVLGDDCDDLFAAGVADMDFPAPPAVLEALSARATHGVFGYEAIPDGLFPALTGWLEARHGWTVNPATILRAPNVLNSIAMAVNLFTDRGDGVIVQPPVFFDFAYIIAENGRHMVTNPLLPTEGCYEMDFAGLERCAADPRTRLLVLCNPHNPVGRVWTREELSRLGAICRAHGVFVIADEIHADITLPGHAYTPFASLLQTEAQNSITCLSPAKGFNIAACCAAFTIIPDAARRAAFQAENSRLTVNKNNAFASVAMQTAYREGGPWLDAVLSYLKDNALLVCERLSGVSGVTAVMPEGTFLMWLDFRALNLTPAALTRFLRTEARWAITPGEAFGEGGAGFGRLNIACPRPRLTKALDDLVAAMAARISTF